MRKFFTAAAFAIAATTAGSAALAFPVPAQPTPPSNSVIGVRDLCGLGWHRGPDGMCYRNGFPYGYRPYAGYASPYYYYPGRCWWTDTAYGARRVCVW
jgi:hypothetical protein